MKTRKMLAALTASVLLCGALVMPASAEEAPVYEMGDVNMDGEVTMLDAQLALEDFLMCMVLGAPHTLSDEQLALADVTDDQATNWDGKSINGVTAKDAQNISQVAALRMMGYEEVTFDNLDEFRCYLFN